MNIQFQEYDGTFFALNPRIERSSDQLLMKLDEQNCTHFLVFSHTSAKAADLSAPQLRERLCAEGERLLHAEDEILTDEITVTCVSYRDYRMHNYAIRDGPTASRGIPTMGVSSAAGRSRRCSVLRCRRSR